MVLEIIKPGRNIVENEKRITICPRCGYEFSYHLSDCISDSRNDMYVIFPNNASNQYIDVTRLNNVKKIYNFREVLICKLRD